MLVGEIRGKATFMTAIHAAETGHLVFGTIHASTASSTIGRILDLFPEQMHGAIRTAIAFDIRGIVAQKLLKSIKPGVSRVPTIEIMFLRPWSRSWCWKAKTTSCPMPSGSRDGMQDFTMSLKNLLDAELIDRPTAFAVAPNPEALKMAIKGIEAKASAML